MHFKYMPNYKRLKERGAYEQFIKRFQEREFRFNPNHFGKPHENKLVIIENYTSVSFHYPYLPQDVVWAIIYFKRSYIQEFDNL